MFSISQAYIISAKIDCFPSFLWNFITVILFILFLPCSSFTVLNDGSWFGPDFSGIISKFSDSSILLTFEFIYLSTMSSFVCVCGCICIPT